MRNVWLSQEIGDGEGDWDDAQSRDGKLRAGLEIDEGGGPGLPENGAGLCVDQGAAPGSAVAPRIAGRASGEQESAVGGPTWRVQVEAGVLRGHFGADGVAAGQV